MTAHLLVTGGAGFIGSHLTRRLLGRGDRVTVLDDFNDFYDPARKRRNVAPFLGRPDYRLVEGDIRDAERVEGSVRRVGVHRRRPPGGAGRGAPQPGGADPLRGRQLHRHPAPARGGAPPRAGGVRLRLLVVGLRHQREGAVFRRRRGRSADQPLRHHQAHRRAALLQLPSPLWPQDLVPALLHRLRAGAAAGDGDPQVHRSAGPGRGGAALRRRRQPPRLHLRRRHRRRHRRRPRPGAGVRDPEPRRRRDHPARRPRPWLAEELGVEPRIRYHPDQPGDVPITYADVTKAGRLLGYSPKVPIREGLRRFVAWYQEAGGEVRR